MRRGERGAPVARPFQMIAGRPAPMRGSRRTAPATVAPMPVLEARGISKTVGAGRAARVVLDGVDLAIEADDVVAVLGRSGSGKSTLLHLLGGLDRPDRGKVVLAGNELTRQNARALARTRLRHIGFVFQSFHLVEELSGEENVLLPARLPGARKGGERRGHRLIRELGLAAVAERRPQELSGGEQQRFAIARALVNDPELVLADEPTGNLDQENGAAVLELLRGLSGRAVVLVTHEPQAAAIADRVFHLSDGRLTQAAQEARISEVRRLTA
jgi:ABC-type lipoprotein export system ATPase subunit